MQPSLLEPSCNPVGESVKFPIRKTLAAEHGSLGGRPGRRVHREEFVEAFIRVIRGRTGAHLPKLFHFSFRYHPERADSAPFRCRNRRQQAKQVTRHSLDSDLLPEIGAVDQRAADTAGLLRDLKTEDAGVIRPHALDLRHLEPNPAARSGAAVARMPGIKDSGKRTGLP